MTKTEARLLGLLRRIDQTADETMSDLATNLVDWNEEDSQVSYFLGLADGATAFARALREHLNG